MTGILYVLLLLGLGLLCNVDELISPCNGAPLPSSTGTAPACKETERMALVEFKKHIIDPSNRLSSWVDQDCCSWEGVSCENTTGNVVGIDLQNRVPPLPSYAVGTTMEHELVSNNRLRGEISPSLLHLQQLNHLDFSGNNFNGTSIPSFIGQFKELRYLDLSDAGFMGSIPTSLGNLSSLQTLHLSHNDFHPYYNGSSDYQWLSNLTSLQNIDMSGVPLGSSSSSLFLALNKLPSIKEIHLSGCEIEAIPLNISSSSLSILDLSQNSINIFSVSGWVFNLKNLEHLDISYNDFHPFYNESSDYQWLSNLTSLQNIGLSGVALGNSSSSLFLALNKLPSIKEIYLSSCEIEAIPLNMSSSSLSILDLSGNSINFSVSGWVFNLTSLEYLDLSYNFYSHRLFGPQGYIWPTTVIPESIGGLCNLKTLHLSWSIINRRLSELSGVFSGCLKNSLTDLIIVDASLKGEIPDWIGDIKNLKSLDLSQNSLSGSLPSSLGKLSFLEELVLFSNELNGTLPEEIGKLRELVNLNVNNNQMSGVISEAHFAQLEKLDTLVLSLNSLVLDVSSNWVPPFLLKKLSTAHCFVGSKFPTWLRTQHKLNELDMSFGGISDTIPYWFWNMTAHNLVDIDLSQNQIEGMMPKSSTFINTSRIDLSSNRFYGPIPEFPGSVTNYIYLSNNSFSGSIPSTMVENVLARSHDTYMQISLSMNKLNGSLPTSLCQLKGLIVLDVSKNQLSGELPDCWLNSPILWNFDLSDNNFTGGIPKSVCHLPDLEVLRLGHNKLYGEFPASLKNCNKVDTLDLSYNNFIGSIPIWVGVSLSNLIILNLKSNNFVGHIPQEISQLKSLQILDLSNNNLLGHIPKGLGNLTAMQILPESDFGFLEILGVGETLQVKFRGIEDEYSRNILRHMRFIDLSNNNLSGIIPEELGSLYGLLGLDLSGNHLEGGIPRTLGGLQQLLSLDLSRNELSGSIPSTLSNLTSLSHFNVSYNNLSGRIPIGNQFNTFEDPSYIGNHICGFPLSNCSEDGGPSKKALPDEEHEMTEDDDDMLWLYIGYISGFVVGFWFVWGILAFKKKWRHAYFRCTENIISNIYVYVIASFAKMKRKIMTNH